MPIYEFKCKECGNEFEELILGRDTDNISCPKCNSSEVIQLMSLCKTKVSGNSLPIGTASSGGCSSCSGGNCSSCG